MARPADISEKRILEVARDLFLERGIAATEMKEIAARAQIGRSSLYRYFPSKEDLAFQIAAEILAALQPQNLPETECTDGRAQLRAVLEQITALLLTHPREVRLLDEFDQLFSGPYPEIEAARRYVEFNRTCFCTPVEDALCHGKADGSLRYDLPDPLACRLLINTLLAAAQRVLPRAAHLREEQGYAEEYLSALPALLVEGLSAK